MDFIARLGLGDVGLPLAAAMGRQMPTIGYDLSTEKFRNYENYYEPRSTAPASELEAVHSLCYRSNISESAKANFIIITVSLLIKAARQFDFTSLISVSLDSSQNMKSVIPLDCQHLTAFPITNIEKQTN